MLPLLESILSKVNYKPNLIEINSKSPLKTQARKV